MILWVFGCILSVCGLSVWLELGSMFPQSGGEKVYLEKAYPRPRLLVTVLFGFYALLSFAGKSHNT